MQEDLKSLKQYCKEAKKRLKNGFWQNYHSNLKNELDRAEKAGVAVLGRERGGASAVLFS